MIANEMVKVSVVLGRDEIVVGIDSPSPTSEVSNPRPKQPTSDMRVGLTRVFANDAGH
jgi:hypothetical protein